MKERRPEIKIIEISRQPFLKIKMKRKMNKLMISFCRIQIKQDKKLMKSGKKE